jgi:FkbM family methyltransferase
MDLPFIARNYSGLVAARLVEQFPSFLPRLRASNGSFKPFVVRRLRGNRIKRVETVDVGGPKMELDLSDDVQRDIYFWLYEGEDLRRCRELIHPGAVCLDVGANVGLYSLHLGIWAGPDGRVFSFEPSPKVYPILKKNIEINALDRQIEAVNAAVGAAAGSVVFNVSHDGHSGWGSVNRFSDVHDSDPVTVRVLTLDGFLIEREIASVDFLKIDVESYEFEVLAGASESLRKKVFRNVLIEWTGGRQTQMGHHYQSLVDLFVGAGYVPDAGTLEILGAFQSGSCDPKTATVNFIFRAP